MSMKACRSLDPAPRLIEENMWRAIRFGLDGRLIDLERGRGVPGARGDRAARRLDRAGARASSASTSPSPSATARSASARMIEAGATREEVFAASVSETTQTYHRRSPYEYARTVDGGGGGCPEGASASLHNPAKRRCARPMKLN